MGRAGGGARAVARRAGPLILAGALLAGAPARPALAQREAVVAAGTTLPIRFLHGLTGGKERPGAPVLAQTLAALAVDGCVLIPPYVGVVGGVTVSRGAGRGGRPGTIGLRFSALAPPGEARIPIDAVLDSLEYALPRDVHDSGLVSGGARARRAVLPLAATAAAAAGEVLVLPVAIVSGVALLRRGPRARIVAGEVGRIRLEAPLALRRTCTPIASHPGLTDIPALPRFAPLAANRAGTRTGDPINLVLLGSGPALDSAFAGAGWQVAGPGTAAALARELTAIVLGGSAYEAPMSTEYFAGRPQDVAWQLPGPNARIRHHLRLWLLDSARGVWVGSAIKDVGVLVRPLTGTATHRVDPDADAERDFVVTSLEASGCARLEDYVAVPGAVRSGRDISRQRFFTDGRVAVLRLRPCPARGP